jgi:hypothetical protein
MPTAWVPKLGQDGPQIALPCPLGPYHRGRETPIPLGRQVSGENFPIPPKNWVRFAGPWKTSDNNVHVREPRLGQFREAKGYL